MLDARSLLPPDPSAFYRVNEEVARELERLDRAGALDGLRALLEGAGAELWVSAARPGDGLEEVVGVLRPGPRPERPAGVPGLPPAPAIPTDGCGCGAEGVDLPAASEAHAGGWDHAGVLTTRSRFTVELPDGTAREVYMPDHVCPSCFNDHDNLIDACARVCARCAFRW
ncbi:MAG: hypothetical protein M9894_39130 [Planctomycetes bacterium]|nr:hypothetical protein [Planctomycetota bacterium]